MKQNSSTFKDSHSESIVLKCFMAIFPTPKQLIIFVWNKKIYIQRRDVGTSMLYIGIEYSCSSGVEK